jgi:hypothetical protein
VTLAYSRSSLRRGLGLSSFSTLYRASPLQTLSVGRPGTGGAENLGLRRKGNLRASRRKPSRVDMDEGGSLARSGLGSGQCESECDEKEMTGASSLLLQQLVVDFLAMGETWARPIDIGAHEYTPRIKST